jgi:hypothetical protein
MSENPEAAHVGGLAVSLGGTTIVATDTVLALAEMLRYAQGRAGHWQASVERIRQLNPDGPLKLSTDDPGMTLLWAWVALGEVEQRSGDLAAQLVTAAEKYGWTEQMATQLAVLWSATVGHELGSLRLLALLVATGTVAKGALAWRVWNGLHDTETQAQNNQRLLTNPAAVVLARLLVSSLDDVAGGALGVPLVVDLLLGDSGFGLIGVSSTAVAVLAVARSRGFFQEGPVTVAPVGTPAVAQPPRGVVDLAAGIPKAVAGRPQVRIDKYGTTEHPSWAVYVGGTIDWNAAATDEPWDLTANVTAMAQQNAGSFEAVMQSMRAAGIGPDDPVVITGHSQGGLVATQVAAAGAFDVRAVATFGAPESRVPVPPGVATLTVEHTDDVITALGGASLINSDDRVTVRREAYASAPLPAGETLPAHHLDSYRETAQLIDASPETNLQYFRANVADVLGSEPGETVMWRGKRSAEGAPTH